MRLWLAGLLLLPLAELVVAILVGRWIGALPTLGLLLLLSIVGMVVVRVQGVAAWRSLNASLRAGQPPPPRLADAAVRVVAGLLLVLPGFLTDVLAVLLFVPVTRAALRRPLQRRFRAAAEQRVTLLGTTFPPGAFPGAARFGAPSDVVEGEVVDDDPPGPRSP